MTPLAPGAHPSPEEVDALLDPPGRARDDAGGRSVATHLAGCAACQDVAESLREVRRLLREEGRRTPPPPAGLGARLDAALARAAAERDGTVVPLHAPGGDGGRNPGGRRPRDLPRWVLVAAGVAVLGGSALAATQVLDGRDPTPTAAGGDSGSSAEAAPDAEAGPQTVSTGTDYRRAELSDQVGALLGASRAGSLITGDAPESAAEAEPGPEPVLPAPGGPLTDPAGLQGCLEAIDAAGEVPLAVDLASFEGEEAAVLVLPGPTSQQVEVWVVARDCRPGADGLLEYQVVTTG